MRPAEARQRIYEILGKYSNPSFPVMPGSFQKLTGQRLDVLLEFFTVDMPERPDVKIKNLQQEGRSLYRLAEREKGIAEIKALTGLDLGAQHEVNTNTLCAIKNYCKLNKRGYKRADKKT